MLQVMRFRLKNHLGTAVGLAESAHRPSRKDERRSPRRLYVQCRVKRGRKRGASAVQKRRENKRTVITPEAPYGECSERRTACGGLLALLKFLDLIGFEDAFKEHYAHPNRVPKLSGYRMVRGMVMLCIGCQRRGHFT